MGHDPTRIEFLRQGIFRWPRWRGGPVLNTAISAVEIALWDILGKLLGEPTYNLLGGRREIRSAFTSIAGVSTAYFATFAAIYLP